MELSCLSTQTAPKAPSLEQVATFLLRNIVENIPVRVFWKDRDSRFLGCNQLFAEDAGLSHPDQLIGKSDVDMGWHAQAARYQADDRAVMDSGVPKLNFEEPQTTPDGRVIWLRTSKMPLRDEQGEVMGVLALYQDISAQKQTEQAQARLTRALQLLSQCNTLLIHAQSEPALLADICRLVVDVGGYHMAWVGFALHDDGKSVRPLAQAGYEAGYLDDANISWAAIDRGQGPAGRAIRSGRTQITQDIERDPAFAPWRDGALARGYRANIVLPLLVEQRILGVLAIYAPEPQAFGADDVSLLEELANNLAFGIDTLRTRSKHAAAKQKLAFLAHYDSLTGLPNRLLLGDRFEQARQAAQRADSGIGVLFLDLDNFMQVNDGLGHACGDQLLVAIAGRLQGCVRATDTISRLGGDEFVILLNQVRDLAVIGKIAQGIVDALAEPFCIDGYQLTTSFSIGISLYPEDGLDLAALLKQADAALYHAKDGGRNTYRFYCARMNSDALELMQLQEELRRALSQQEFRLHYQPQIDARSGRILGVEALLRWQHPTLGLLLPERFMPQAELSGLIIPIGDWVLRQACEQLRIWQQEHDLPPMRMAVNLSALQFRRGQLVETVVGALAQSGVAASQLELELTEAVLLSDPARIGPALAQLKALGVGVAIDDFGSGHSSLAALRQLAVDKLKIDPAFVRDLLAGGDHAIAHAIIQLGHTLGLMVIAEGVETVAEQSLLEGYGCDQLQGHLFGQAQPAEAFVDFYRRQQASLSMVAAG